MKLFMIPITYAYGGGYSVLLLADNIEDARKRAKEFNDRFDDVAISDEANFGDIDKFEYALIGYSE